MEGKVEQAAHGGEDSSLVDNPGMSALQFFRSDRRIARWVLAWFASACMVAVAAPIVAPQNSILVCTAAGEVKWVPVGAADSAAQAGGDLDGGFGGGLDAGAATASHKLDCVLCLPSLVPPPAPTAHTLPTHANNTVPLAQLAVFIGRPGYATPPARGPPARS
jgi:hypothetical protein